MTDKLVTFVKRFAMFAVGVGLLIASFKFSVDGFRFVEPGALWIAYILAAMTIVFELVFNDDGFSGTLTMSALGVASYAYGIATNVIGFWVAQGMPDYFNNGWLGYFSIIIALSASIIMEVAAEPAILYGLRGKGGDRSDPVGKVIRSMRETPRGYQPRPKTHQPVKKSLNEFFLLVAMTMLPHTHEKTVYNHDVVAKELLRRVGGTADRFDEVYEAVAQAGKVVEAALDAVRPIADLNPELEYLATKTSVAFRRKLVCDDAGWHYVDFIFNYNNFGVSEEMKGKILTEDEALSTLTSGTQGWIPAHLVLDLLAD